LLLIVPSRPHKIFLKGFQMEYVGNERGTE
jgi:hypothetical protein